MQIASPPTAQKLPLSDADRIELATTALASVKPSALSRAETKLTELRDQRAELSASLIRIMSEERARGGIKPRADAVAIEQRLAALDEDIRSARRALHKCREAFAVDFHRVADEFRRQAAENIRGAMPALVEAFKILEAFDSVAMRSGMEFQFHSPGMKAVLQTLKGFGGLK